MKESKFSWSISTVKIFLDNVNESKAPQLLFDKEYLDYLVNDLKKEYKNTLAASIKNNVIAGNITIAIEEIENWAVNLNPRQIKNKP